ncbi:MAG: glycosyltransferase [Bacteroidales bacterium]|nr:glycosyltransferase [Bacteroidales bacterium]
MIILYIISFLLIFCVLLYAFLITTYTIGWLKIKYQENKSSEKHSVSVLIPARNEAKNIERILQAINHQEYPKEQLEIIVADDHSEDETASLVSLFIQKHPDFNLKLHSVQGKGKKSALSEMVQMSNNVIIITTDSDCVPQNNQWIRSIVSCFAENTQLVSAPVVYFQKKGVFQNMQSLEFLTLISSAAGAIGIHAPFMCNGANIAFRKTAFLETHGFENDTFASGDDVFLLERILQRYGAESVRFAKSRQAIIETDSMPTLSKFFQQRIRWAGKSVGYKNPVSIFTSYIVFFNAFSIILSSILGFYHPIFWIMAVIFLIVKMIVDVPICWMILKFFNRISLFKIYVPLQIVYPFYICGTAILSLFIQPKWKGRSLKKH